MMHNVREVFRHIRAPIDFEEIALNAKTASDSLIDQTALAIRRNGVGLKGIINCKKDKKKYKSE
jgi:hypothetical protein